MDSTSTTVAASAETAFLCRAAERVALLRDVRNALDQLEAALDQLAPTISFQPQPERESATPWTEHSRSARPA